MCTLFMHVVLSCSRCNMRTYITEQEMNKWLALAMHSTPTHSGSRPYWRSESEGLFVSTRTYGSGVRTPTGFSRGVREIALRLESESRQRRGCEPGTSTEKFGDQNNTPPLTPAFNPLSKSTNTFPRGSNLQDVLFPEGRMITQTRRPPPRLRNNKQAGARFQS